MFERKPEYFRQFQKLFRDFICNIEPQFDSNLTKKTSQTASTKMKIIAKYNNFIAMSLLLLINYRSPSRILLLNHLQYHVSHLFSTAHSGVFSHSALWRSDEKISRGSQLQRPAQSSCFKF